MIEIWRLRVDVLSTHALLWLAGAGRTGEPVPEVHLYLYDRYWRLAKYYERRGNARKAAAMRSKAEVHYHDSGHDGPPFAAVAMQRPARPSRTPAAMNPRESDSDDAA